MEATNKNSAYPEQILYHYTDQTGFLGIFSNEEIWATKIQYLNDTKEFALGLDITAEELKKSHLNKSPMSNDREFISSLIEETENIRSCNICVCSFSENKDLLSQWRGYSKGQGGYSIGFKKSILEEKLKNKNTHFDKCIYDEKVYKKRIKRIINEAIDEYYDLSKPRDTSPILDKFSNRILITSSIIKDIGFKEESEWRLITISDFESIEFRPGQSTLIPYRRIKLNDLILTSVAEIIIGHTPNPDLAKQSTIDFLVAKFPPKDEADIRYLSESGEYDYRSLFHVRGSKIPFRNW